MPRHSPATAVIQAGETRFEDSPWGFRSFAGLTPSRDRAVVVLSNTARSVDRLGWHLLDEG